MDRKGVVQRFDAADGLGDILLDDGTIVRFGTSALKDFRSVVPAPGLHVLVGETKPGFRGALRASEVRLAEASWDETWHVVGIEAPRLIETEIPRKRVRLIPFDMGAFPRLASALSKADVDGRSFSQPTPVHLDELHPVLSSLAPLVVPHARVALGFSRASGEPAPGATFVGGSYADLGSGMWPAPAGTPLTHVLQIGRSDAEVLGFDQQINVFTGSLPPASLDTPMLEALGMAPLFGAVPRGNSPFLVVASRGGSRRQSPVSATPGVALGRGVARMVYPPLDAFHSDNDAVKSQVAAFVTRVYVVDAEGYAFAPDLCLRSVQAYYATAFPSADDLGDDIVLGGIAPPLHREGSPRKRLASVELVRFPEIRPTITHGDDWLAGDGELYWKRWAIDWSADANPQSWAYGR
jgi:hypothetical protein